jgi:iron complex outermembrane receptor protein
MMSSGRSVWRSHSLPVLSSVIALSVAWIAPARAQSAPPDAATATPPPVDAKPPADTQPPAEATAPAAPALPPTPDATPPAPFAPPAPPAPSTPPPAEPVRDTAPPAEPSGGTPSIAELSAMSLEDLLNVEVVAPSKKAELESDAPAVVQVITAREISWLGFNTLEEVLEYAVGLSSINGEGNTFTTTTVRGNTLVNYQTNTLLLLDGVPIYRPYDGSFDFLAIPLSAIKQIEIVKGSNSVLYGTNAISAVIDIRTKDKDTASALLRLGRFNSMHSEVSFYKKYDNDVTASVFVDSTSTTGEPQTFVDEKSKTLHLKKSLEAHAVIATLGYKGFVGRIQQFERDAPSVKTRGFPIVTDPSGKQFPKPELNDETGWLVTGGYAHKLDDKTQLATRLTYYQWRLDKDITNGLWTYTSKQLQAEADLDLNPVSWTSVTLGTQFEYQKARRYQGDVGMYDIGKDNNPTYTAALYANGEARLPQQPVSFFYGARYYLSVYDGTDGSVKLQNLSPRAAVVYKPINSVVLKGIFGQSFRAPTYFEKEVSSAQVLGNTELKPEKSTSFDLAATYKGPFFNINVDFFHQTIRDKITRVRLPDPDTRSQNQNVGDVTFDGIETWGKFQMSSRIEGFVGHSWIARAKQDAGDGMGALDFKFSYDHQLTAGFLAKIGDRVGFSASAKYLTSWEDAPAYGLLNAQLMYDVAPQLQCALSVHNITGSNVELPEIARDDDDVPTIPKTEVTTVYGSVSYTF